MIKKIGITGAGTMGASIAQTFALFNYEVTVYDIFETALDKADLLILTKKHGLNRVLYRKKNRMN